MKLTKAHWDERYKNKETGWDIGHVSTPIKTYFDGLDNKELSILIPGCGNAHEAEYLYQNGFKNVEIIDLSPTAIDNFKSRVPDFPAAQIHCKNFFDLDWKYDVIVEQTFFCAIDIDLRPAYAQQAHQLLKDGGYLVGLLWNKAMRIDHPPYGGSTKEYETLFSPYFKLTIMEDCHNSIPPRLGNELFVKFDRR